MWPITQKVLHLKKPIYFYKGYSKISAIDTSVSRINTNYDRNDVVNTAAYNIVNSSIHYQAINNNRDSNFHTFLDQTTVILEYIQEPPMKETFITEDSINNYSIDRNVISEHQWNNDESVTKVFSVFSELTSVQNYQLP